MRILGILLLVVFGTLLSACGPTYINQVVTYMAWGFEAAAPVMAEGDAVSRQTAELLLNGRAYDLDLGNKLGQPAGLSSRQVESFVGDWSYGSSNGPFYGSGYLTYERDTSVLFQSIVSGGTSDAIETVHLGVSFDSPEVEAQIRQLSKHKINASSHEPIPSAETFTVTGNLTGEVNGHPVNASFVQEWRVLREDVGIW